jgi:hypothetical protein
LSEPFGPRRSAKLADLVERAFLERPISAPLQDEREPTFTARALAPVIVELVKSRDLRDVSCLGDGLGPVPRVYFLGVEQRPDIALIRYEERLIAIEVKYLRPRGKSFAACVGLGQSLLYQRAGFAISMAIFVDLGGSLTVEDVARAQRLFSGIEYYRLLFFSKQRRVLKGVLSNAI